MGSLVLLWYHLHDKRIMDNLGCVVSYATPLAFVHLEQLYSCYHIHNILTY